MTTTMKHAASQSDMKEDEWHARVELAALYRLTAMFGWDQLIYNHISVRVPGEPEAFLVNPFGIMFDEMRASDLTKVYSDGTAVGEKGYGVNEAGFFLHSVLHDARPDINCVMHFHSVEVAAVANHPQGLLPLCQEAMLNFDTISYHDFGGILVDDTERESLIEDLGQNNIMLLRNHGVAVVGRSVPATFNRAFNLDKACKIQVATLAQGAQPVQPEQAIVDSVIKTYSRLSGPDLGRLEFDALMRKLDRLDPSYRQ
ncbi:class II aldolase/adducin family protein [Henriciella mobilis]|uniref:Class II aldolase/adducin family protein n=1 Tax=Henriciella mobilis TaxID=2305467 RepID=A0A399RNF5_9PROT|nr:class II aldolase/adducin family protein [Henriciella mobilis]RIJ32728.1 class II aldolase/adducin family protein [Henriciella mobilis]